MQSEQLTNLLEQWLERSQAVEWQSQLTAVFFDGDAKREVVREIREAIAGEETGLPEGDLGELQQAVIAQLAAQASRDATRPEEAEAEGERLEGWELEDAITRTYPYPVAVPYRALTQQESSAGAFGCLLDTFESLLHYLATVAVSAYVQSDSPEPECSRRLLEKLVKGVWTTGDMFELLTDTVRLAGDCGGCLPYAKLVSYLFKRNGKWTASCEVLDSFVTLRNRAWGHGGGRDEAFFADILPPNRARLEEELARMPWLADGDLIRPIDISDDGVITRADLLMGDRRKKDGPFELAIREDDGAAKGGNVRAEKSLLLVAPNGEDYLPLFPISLFGVQQRSQGVFFLQRSEWEHGHTWALQKASYVAYDSRLEDYQEEPGNPAARSLESMVNGLASGLEGSGVGTEAIAPASVPAEDPDVELPRTEQEFHLRTFAGREKDLGSISEWIESKAEGGYLLLLGPPGQGKSALMAELARRESEGQGCLLHMMKSHRNPLKFLPSLIRQAARLGEARFGAEAYAGDQDDLRNALVKGAEAVRDRTGRALLVIDALDELDPVRGRIDFLPPTLPAGVRAVLTCRPDIPLVDALRARVPNLEERELAPLSEADLPAFLERRLEVGVVRQIEHAVDWSALFRRLQGNPLFLQRALTRIERAAGQSRDENRPLEIDVESLPASLAAVLRDIYDEVAEREGARFTSEEGRDKARLLQLLCLARESLGFEALAELMAREGRPLLLEDCRDRIAEMSQFLLAEGGARFRPWHQGLADFVRERILGAPGIRQTESLYCDWLSRPAGEQTPYGLRNRVSHLLAAERFDEVEQVLTDLGWIKARALAGQVFEMVGDYRTVFETRPDPRDEQEKEEDLQTVLARNLASWAQGTDPYASDDWWGRIRAFSSFVSSHAHQIGSLPSETVTLARAQAESGAVAEQAGPLCERRSRPWLARDPRPPVPSIRPACLQTLEGHSKWVVAVAVTPDGKNAISASWDQTLRVWDLGWAAKFPSQAERRS